MISFNLLLCFITVITLCIILFFYFSIKSLKSKLSKNLSIISDTIILENKYAKDMQVQRQKMTSKHDLIHHQLLSIHLDIKDVDFSIKEICKFI